MAMDEPLLTDIEWQVIDDLRAGVPFADMVARRATNERDLRRLISGASEKLRIASSLYGTEPVAPSGDDDEGPRMRVAPMDPCPFCENIAGRFAPDRAPAVIFEDDLVYVFLTRGPLGGMPGHALVCPKRHVETIFDLSPDEEAALGQGAARMARVLRTVLDPHGLLIQQHNGAAAFQTVPHVHFHVVPKSVGPFPPLEPPPLIPTDELFDLAGTLRTQWADLGCV